MSSVEPASPAPTTYDETPYPSASFPFTHPCRLAAMGRLFGVGVADPSNAKVLEIGCADGANLLPMAASLPGASFLGIDASRVQIETGKKTIAAAGLTNVEIRLQNMMEFPADAGEFDFIIAHGVFSWIPENVREKLLAICSRHLAPRGLAFISYNALPGWNMRRSLREMMLFHTRAFTDPKMKVKQARALIAFLAESVPTEGNAYGMLLKNELQFMSGQSDAYLRHDILEEENTPFYFHDFLGKAGKHGLQYVSEPSIAQMLATNFPDKVRETLAKLTGQIIAQEQYMDFLRNRAFRQTILCRATVQLKRNLDGSAMRQFAYQSLLKTGTKADLASGVAATFTSNAGTQISASDTFVKAILQVLADATSANVLAFSEILDAARRLSRPLIADKGPSRDAVDQATLESNLLNLFAKGFVEVWSDPVHSNRSVADRPFVSPLVRHQAMHANYVTNCVHQAMPANGLSRNIMDLCNGKRTHDELLVELMQRVKEGKLQVKEGDAVITEESRVRDILRPRLQAILEGLAASGLFGS